MGRYSKTNIVKVYDKKTKSYINKKATTIYDKMGDTTLSNDDIYVISTEGDRLDLLANQFYGDASLWWYIAQANNINTINLSAGTSLRIPVSTQYAKGS